MAFERPRRFDEEFEARRRQFNVVWKIAIGFIFFVFLTIIAQYVFFGYIAYKVAPTIEQSGVKGAIESLWYGKEGPR